MRLPVMAPGCARACWIKPIPPQKQGFVSKIHRKKPHLKPMSRHIQKSNAGKSVIRSRTEHVFADQKSQMGLFIRTVGIARATMRVGLANIVYNMRLLFSLYFLSFDRCMNSAESFHRKYSSYTSLLIGRDIIAPLFVMGLNDARDQKIRQRYDTLEGNPLWLGA